MPRYEISLMVMVPAFYDMEVEADTADNAKVIALADDMNMHKSGPNTYGSEWNVEWGEREAAEVNEIREIAD
jgi:hypothetical protein